MPESHDLCLGFEFFLQPIFRAIRRLNLLEHFHRLFVCAAMQRTFERPDRRRHRRINARQRRSGHSRRKRRRVELVIGIKIKNRVHHPRLPRLRHFTVQFVKEIAGLVQLRFFRQRFFTL